MRTCRCSAALLPPAQAFLRLCGAAFAGAGAFVSFFPDTGSSRLACRRSEAALRLGCAVAVSCARLRLSAATNELVLAVYLARAEATSRHARVAIAPRVANNWASGWYVFVDANDNGVLDPGESVVRVFDPVPANMTVATTFGSFDGHVLSFDHAGLLRDLSGPGRPRAGP